MELLYSENKLIKEQLGYLRNFISQAIAFSFPFVSGGSHSSVPSSQQTNLSQSLLTPNINSDTTNLENSNNNQKTFNQNTNTNSNGIAHSPNVNLNSPITSTNTDQNVPSQFAFLQSLLAPLSSSTPTLSPSIDNNPLAIFNSLFSQAPLAFPSNNLGNPLLQQVVLQQLQQMQPQSQPQTQAQSQSTHQVKPQDTNSTVFSTQSEKDKPSQENP